MNLLTTFTTDIITVVVGALISAVVAWGVAGARAKREEQGKSQHGAKQKIEQLAGNVLNAVTDYQDGRLYEMQRSSSDNRIINDYEFASRLLIAAKQLGLVRRLLVRRRVQRLVGQTVFNQAERRPDRLEQNRELEQAVKEIKNELVRQAAIEGAVKVGLLARNLQQLNNSQEVEALRKELALLARCC